MMRCFAVLILILILSPGLGPGTVSGAEQDSAGPAAPDAVPGRPSFNREVRPILADRCFACHGFDARTRQADLRLDTFEGATADRPGRPAIVPRDLHAGELWRRINSTDPDIRMPPPDSGRELTAAGKDTLRRWIEAGAQYEPHWAFVPPRRSPLPTVSDPDWCRNPIDQLILARLEQAGLSPSPTAGKETLLRRVTLDLTGLPVEPADRTAFLNDTRPRAWLRLVDRLIDTPAAAERRAQDWLDLARYADTRGFADDQTRHIWPYRDWVIQALQRNMPFDQFTIQQLAGDMLPDASVQQRLASAFHRNAPQAKGNTYPVEEYRLKGVVDRVNTTARVWLGLTLGCAECHDHKFDPVSQQDYYALFALFNNIEHSGTGFAQGGPTMPYRALSVEKSRERQRIEAALAAERKRLPPGQLPDGPGLLGTWNGPRTLADPDACCPTGDLTICATIRTNQPTVNILSKYDWRGGQRSYVFGIGGEGDRNGIPGHLFAWFSAKPDPYQGVEIYGSRNVSDGRDHQVAVVFTAGKSVRLFVDGREDTAARIIGKPPGSIAKSTRRLAIGAGYKGTDQPEAFRFQGTLQDVRLYSRALQAAEGLLTTSPAIRELAARLAAFDKANAAIAVDVAAVPVMRERQQPRETFIHVRGNFLDRGPLVAPAVPTLFGVPDQSQPRDRLAFARWLVNGNNPLVARVVVNRFWQTYFGHGLVRTPEDFGVQGAPPSHPELLDWLACEFVDSGWDMRHIHRLIVNSATYRQSTRRTDRLISADPDNVLLARMPRVRLPAEQIRDQALAVSGLLVRTAGGPGVFPPQPENYWQQRALPGTWTTVPGAGSYRRTLYTYWRRMALHPSLELLNAPPRAVCVARRKVSNVPTQALVLLNDPMFHEAAQALARRLMQDVDSTAAARLEHAFRLVLNRSPQPAERRRFLEFLTRERQELRGDPAAVAALAGTGQHTAAVEQSAWVLICSVLLNLDETVTRP